MNKSLTWILGLGGLALVGWFAYKKGWFTKTIVVGATPSQQNTQTGTQVSPYWAGWSNQTAKEVASTTVAAGQEASNWANVAKAGVETLSSLWKLWPWSQGPSNVPQTSGSGAGIPVGSTPSEVAINGGGSIWESGGMDNDNEPSIWNNADWFPDWQGV